MGERRLKCCNQSLSASSLLGLLCLLCDHVPNFVFSVALLLALAIRAHAGLDTCCKFDIDEHTDWTTTITPAPLPEADTCTWKPELPSRVVFASPDRLVAARHL